MKTTRIALAATLMCAAHSGVYSAPAGTLLFAQPGSTIVDEAGVSRPARRGDVLQTGERLITAPNSITQLAMTDGTLVGVRPGSELKFELPTASTDRARQMVSLVQGAVRVIGAELMDSNKLSTVSFRSGDATLQMRGADLETARVVGGSTSTQGTPEGSYSRLLTGTASVTTGLAVTALAPRQVSFVAPLATTPTVMTSISPTLFTSSVPVTSTLVSAPLNTSLRTVSGTPIATTSTLTQPLITATPITNVLGTTTLAVAPVAGTTAPAPAPSTSPAYVAPLPQLTLIQPSTTVLQPVNTAVTSSVTNSLINTTKTRCLALLRTGC